MLYPFLNLLFAFAVTRSMRSDLLRKGFFNRVKVQVQRVGLLDALLLKKRSTMPARRYTIDNVKSVEKELEDPVPEVLNVEQMLALPPIVLPNEVEEPAASQQIVLPIVLPGLKKLKVKSILKKPNMVPIGVRGRRKSTAGRIESADLDPKPNPNPGKLEFFKLTS